MSSGNRRAAGFLRSLASRSAAAPRVAEEAALRLTRSIERHDMTLKAGCWKQSAYSLLRLALDVEVSDDRAVVAWLSVAFLAGSSGGVVEGVGVVLGDRDASRPAASVK